VTAAYWLAKSEPETYSIHDLARDGRTHWEGVRNYMARNYLRQMSEGDLVLYYHSNAEPSGVAGLARVARAAYPDLTARDPASDYHDPGDTQDEPRWSMVDVAHVETWPRVVSLDELRQDTALAGLEVTRKGSRLSVTPVSADHFARILALARQPAPTGSATTPAKAVKAEPAKAEPAKATKAEPAKKAKAKPAKKAKAKPAKKAKAKPTKKAKPAKKAKAKPAKKAPTTR
jgi:predicted RNA-binding protein with PUA-like domain